MTSDTGHCLCGAVVYAGKGERGQIHVCHCADCRRWSGGPSMNVSFSQGLDIENPGQVNWFRSSEWAERGSCRACGSTLFYRLLDDPSFINVSAGSLDDASGFGEIEEHIFIELEAALLRLQGRCSARDGRRSVCTFPGVAGWQVMTQEKDYGEAWVREYLEKRDKLIAANAYNPADEKDSCGVGLVVQIDGTPRREIVEMAIRALKAVWHRGAVDADGKTGDGAGIRIDVPQDFFRDAVRSQGHTIANDRQVCVGQIFLPRTDLAQQEKARSIIETEVVRFGFYIYGWRQPPIDTSVIGQKANATRPEIEQILFRDSLGRDAPELERALYVCRRRIEKRAREAALDLYVCSFSARALIYKGMFLAQDIDAFYLDLKDPRFVSAVAIYHQRYSTNTFPQWRLAQPFRMLAHNGEINTRLGQHQLDEEPRDQDGLGRVRRIWR